MGEFAGLLQNRIEVWQQTEDRHATGVSADTWRKVANARAHIEAEGTGKSIEGMSLSASPRFRVLLRARPSLEVGQRIHWGSRRLIIMKVIADPSEQDRMTLLCEELRP